MILLNPGPVNVSPRVQKALLRGDLCHREKDFIELHNAIREKLTRAFGGTAYRPLVLTGSGTAVLEAAVASILPPQRKLLVVDNGVYGERIASIARAHRLPVTVLKGAWTRPPDPDRIRQILRRDRSVAAVAMVHHETTTGLINPVREVGALCRTHRKTYLVDAISGLGGEEIDLEREGIDLCVGTANKCIQGLPGVSFVLASKALLRRMAAFPPRGLYLHLPLYDRHASQGTVPFTPSVQICYALDEALAELLEEGVSARIVRYRRAADLLRRGFTALGLRMMLPEAWRSNTLTALHLPPRLSYTTLHDRIREKGFVIYAGQGALSRKIFRIANMGHLPIEAFEGCLRALDAVLPRADDRGFSKKRPASALSTFPKGGG